MPLANEFSDEAIVGRLLLFRGVTSCWSSQPVYEERSTPGCPVVTSAPQRKQRRDASWRKLLTTGAASVRRIAPVNDQVYQGAARGGARAIPHSRRNYR